MEGRQRPVKVIDDFITLHDKVDLVFATDGRRSHFFGYYDKSPFSVDERRLLCHAVAFDGRAVLAEDIAEVGFWDIFGGSYTRLGETRAFNWQQGSMLQWLPGSDYSQVIFNDRIDASFVAVIMDVNSGNRRILPTTIYSLTPDGRYALTPRFERLYYCRPGYCYEGIEQPRWNANLPPGDGIVLMDLHDGSQELIVETAALVQNRGLSSMNGATHYVEHIMVNPDGSNCIFFHRWFIENDSVVTRLYACSLDGTNLQLFPDSGYYSHANWVSDDQFIIWGRAIGTYARVRRSVFATKWFLSPLLRFYRRHYHNPLVAKMKRRAALDAFLLFSVNNEPPTPVGADVLVADGHPSICPGDRRFLLTDTYEDGQNYRHLILYNMDSGEAVELGRFFSPSRFNRTVFRCDLHPRWSPSGRMICIDTIRDGRRQMLVLDVADVLGELQPNQKRG